MKKEKYLLSYDDKVFFEVVKIDERQNFGRKDYKILPVAGHGEIWVQEESLKPYYGKQN